MEKKQSWWQILAKAAVIGGTMTVPGASGGTMAMLLGIYEDLIETVGGLAAGKRPLWDSLRFLALFCVGALGGIALFARGVLSLLERYPIVVSYFFLGAVAGGIPLIWRQAKVKKMTWQALLLPLTGLCIVYGLAALPEGLFTPGHFLFQLLGGCILAIALILPGVSVSQMLLMLGLYEPVMTAVSQLRFIPLVPMGLGAVLCTLFASRLLGSAMKRHPQPTYLLILGLVLGSLGELYPGLPTGWSLLFAALAAVAGYQLFSRLSRALPVRG